MLNRVHINTSGENKIEILIKELYLENTQSIFIWPSSLVLSAYLACNPEICRNHVFYELGAGTGLPSLVAAKLNASKCYITEKRSSIQFELLHYNIAINQLEYNCQVEALNWGNDIILPPQTTSTSSNSNIQYPCTTASIDYIIGADLFYSSEDFDNILKSVASVLCCKNNNNSDHKVIFLTTYHQRSIQRTLLPFLDKYDLSCCVEKLSSFLHTSHTVGECEMITLSPIDHGNKTSSSSSTSAFLSIPTFDEIFLLRIYHTQYSDSS